MGCAAIFFEHAQRHIAAGEDRGDWFEQAALAAVVFDVDELDAGGELEFDSFEEAARGDDGFQAGGVGAVGEDLRAGGVVEIDGAAAAERTRTL